MYMNKKFILLIIFIGTIIICSRIVLSMNARSISPLPDNHTQSSSVLGSIFSKQKNPDDLKKLIRDLVADDIPIYSVLVIDYNSNFSAAINDQVMFTAASVNKIPILAALYYLAQKGEIDLDKNITVQRNDIQEGTGIAQLGSVYSVKTLAKLMMQQSDNTAAFILANQIIGIDTLNTLLESWNLLQTDIMDNKSSNNDMSILFQKMYKGNIANPASTKEMFAFMKDTDFEDRIPELLPASASVYHKIGTAIGAFHDVGIVDAGNSRYYIGIFTANIPDEDKTTKIIQNISKTVYDFMTKN